MPTSAACRLLPTAVGIAGTGHDPACTPQRLTPTWLRADAVLSLCVGRRTDVVGATATVRYSVAGVCHRERRRCHQPL